MPGDPTVTTVRAFNRFYTGVIGVLDEGLNRTAYTLTEARVLFELAQQDRLEVVELRRRMGIDAGYLTRILTRFERDGLVSRERSATDGRRQVIALSTVGADAAAMLDRRSSEDVAKLIGHLKPADRGRLMDAVGTVRSLLDRGGERAPLEVSLRQPAPGDLGWIVARHGALYAQEYGFDATFEGLVAGIVADFAAGHDSARERAWIAEVDGVAVGCVLCVRDDDATAKLRLLLVEPSARGLGVGSRLVDACVAFARDAGYARMVLWTNDVLAAARRIYQRAGFRLVDEEPHHSFGADLVGQHWSLDLT